MCVGLFREELVVFSEFSFNLPSGTLSNIARQAFLQLTGLLTAVKQQDSNVFSVLVLISESVIRNLVLFPSSNRERALFTASLAWNLAPITHFTSLLPPRHFYCSYYRFKIANMPTFTTLHRDGTYSTLNGRCFSCIKIYDSIWREFPHCQAV